MHSLPLPQCPTAERGGRGFRALCAALLLVLVACGDAEPGPEPPSGAGGGGGSGSAGDGGAGRCPGWPDVGKVCDSEGVMCSFHGFCVAVSPPCDDGKGHDNECTITCLKGQWEATSATIVPPCESQAAGGAAGAAGTGATAGHAGAAGQGGAGP